MLGLMRKKNTMSIKLKVSLHLSLYHSLLKDRCFGLFKASGCLSTVDFGSLRFSNPLSHVRFSLFKGF